MARAFAWMMVGIVTFGCGKTKGEVVGERPRLPEAPIAAGPGRARGPIADEEQAIRKFHLAWAEEVVPPVADHRQRGDWDTWLALNDAGPKGQRTFQKATRNPCSEEKLHVLDPDASADGLVIFGSPAHLARDGDCWHIESRPEFVGGHLIGIHSASDGALLYVYVLASE